MFAVNAGVLVLDVIPKLIHPIQFGFAMAAIENTMENVVFAEGQNQVQAQGVAELEKFAINVIRQIPVYFAERKSNYKDSSHK